MVNLMPNSDTKTTKSMQMKNSKFNSTCVRHFISYKTEIVYKPNIEARISQLKIAKSLPEKPDFLLFDISINLSYISVRDPVAELNLSFVNKRGKQTSNINKEFSASS